jgi:hypothetical protein
MRCKHASQRGKPASRRCCIDLVRCWIASVRSRSAWQRGRQLRGGASMLAGKGGLQRRVAGMQFPMANLQSPITNLQFPDAVPHRPMADPHRRGSIDGRPRAGLLVHANDRFRPRAVVQVPGTDQGRREIVLTGSRYGLHGSEERLDGSAPGRNRALDGRVCRRDGQKHRAAAPDRGSKPGRPAGSHGVRPARCRSPQYQVFFYIISIMRSYKDPVDSAHAFVLGVQRRLKFHDVSDPYFAMS